MQIATKRKTPKRKTPKRKTPKRKTPKRKTPKRKTPKRRNTLKPNIMKGGVAIYFYDENNQKQTPSTEIEELFNLEENHKNSVIHENLHLDEIEGDRTYSILKSNPGVYGKHTLQKLGTLHKDTSIITINAVDVDVIQQYVLIDMVYTTNKLHHPTYIMKPYSKL